MPMLFSSKPRLLVAQSKPYCLMQPGEISAHFPSRENEDHALHKRVGKNAWAKIRERFHKGRSKLSVSFGYDLRPLLPLTQAPGEHLLMVKDSARMSSPLRRLPTFWEKMVSPFLTPPRPGHMFRLTCLRSHGVHLCTHVSSCGQEVGLSQLCKPSPN